MSFIPKPTVFSEQRNLAEMARSFGGDLKFATLCQDDAVNKPITGMQQNFASLSGGKFMDFTKAPKADMNFSVAEGAKLPEGTITIAQPKATGRVNYATCTV